MFGSDPIGWKVMDNIFTIGGEEDPDIVLVHPVCADSATKTPERIICEHSGIKFVADGVGVAPRVTSSKLVLAKDSEFIVVLTVPEDLTKLDFGDGGLDGNNQVTWTPEDSGTIHCGAASYSAVKTAVEVWVWRMPG
jgi:hypothetical protein